MLHVKLVNPSPVKSVSVYDSDVLGNLLHMETLVGTLVKYGSRGIYEPYFAKSWSINKQKTQFKFIIENNLLDEKGDSQTAESYYRTLHVLLKKYSETTEPPIFSTLVGWQNFKKGKADSISGLKFDSANNSISFHFEKPASGLMEFLAMPYFGFYNLNDFDSHGAWKNNQAITATGAYKLVELGENKIVLQKRPNFKLSQLNSYENITIETDNNNKIEILQKHQLLIHNTDLDFGANKSAITTFKSTPTFLYAYELNPLSKKFKNSSERKKVFQALKRATESILEKNSEFTPAHGFYSDQKINLDTSSSALGEDLNLIFLKRKNAQTTKYDYISDQILGLLQKQGDIKITTKDNVPGDGYIKSVEFNDTFDFRIKSVDIGYAAENWVIKMMFCSNLGITFPDPDKQIMKLTEQYDNGMFAEESEYAAAFESILLDQAYIIPIFRDGFSFSITENVDSESISRTTNVPRIDLISPKNQ